MAVDRVARRRERADQILALDPSQGYHVPRAGRPHQAALADRARLSGTQAGGWAWAFRGQRMARLPPPRHAVHHRLRIPGLREGDDSPLWTSFRQAVRETSVPNGYRPRGSAAANPTTRPELDRDTAHTPQRRPRQQIIEMPMLRNSNTQKHTTQKFVTQ